MLLDLELATIIDSSFINMALELGVIEIISLVSMVIRQIMVIYFFLMYMAIREVRQISLTHMVIVREILDISSNDMSLEQMEEDINYQVKVEDSHSWVSGHMHFMEVEDDLGIEMNFISYDVAVMVGVA